MTAAQALTPGLGAPSSAGRASNGGSASERGGASFRDALDGASKGTSEARGRARTSSDQRSGEAESSTGPMAQDAGALPGTPPGQAQTGRDVSRSAGGGGPDATTSLVQRLQAALSKADDAATAGTADDGGPWLPGLVDEDGEAFDATRLLAIMRSRGAQGASSSGGATVVTVLGQERHLALARLPAELAAQLGDDQDIAAALRGEAKAAANAAALSAQVEPGADGVERGRGKIGGEELRLATEAGVGRGKALFGSEGRGQSGPGLGERGQEGGQQDGRGSGGSGQSTSGAFASAMQNPGLQASNAARGGYGAAGAHDPVGDQIAARIRADLNADGLGETSSEGVVKVLNLELKPANLGAVTLRMSLKDNVITLQVETQNAETRALIEREQAKLTSTLSAAGYTVEAITTVQSDGLRMGGVVAQGDPNSATFQQPGSQSQASSEFSGEGRSGRSSPGGGEPESQSRAKDDGAASANRGVDGVYV